MRLPSRRGLWVAAFTRTVRYRSPETDGRLFRWPTKTRGGRWCVLARLWGAEERRA